MAMRIRLTYAKTAVLRYTGSLDMQRSWERTLRRARLPVAYTQGFHPQQRINQASGLPLGFTSRAEMIDFWLDGDFPLEQVRSALKGAVPPGVELIEVVTIPSQAPSIQSITSSAEYEVTLADPVEGDRIATRIAEILASEHLPRQRKEKNYDLRPLIEALELSCPDGNQPVMIKMRLAARPSATGRPEEVLLELGLSIEDASIQRTALLIDPGAG
jgi:radical SAM-linked protein